MRRAASGGDIEIEYSRDTCTPRNRMSLVSNPPQIMLAGATTTVGEALLLRLALAGYEVTAFMPDDADEGRTGEFAAHVVRGAHAPEQPPGVFVAMVLPDVHEVMLGIGRGTIRVRHAPLFPDVVAAIRTASWWNLWKDPWHGHALPLVHPRDVAEQCLRLLQDAPMSAAAGEANGGERISAIGGPEPLTWCTVVDTVCRADSRRPWWRPLVGRVVARGAPSFDAVEQYPRIGRRTLSDFLCRRESAAQRLVGLPSPDIQTES